MGGICSAYVKPVDGASYVETKQGRDRDGGKEPGSIIVRLPDGTTTSYYYFSQEEADEIKTRLEKTGRVWIYANNPSSIALIPLNQSNRYVEKRQDGWIMPGNPCKAMGYYYALTKVVCGALLLYVLYTSYTTAPNNSMVGHVCGTSSIVSCIAVVYLIVAVFQPGVQQFADIFTRGM